MHLTQNVLLTINVFILLILVPSAVPQSWQSRSGSVLEYLVSADAMTCTNAQRFCAERGGHTAILKDSQGDERQYVNNLATQAGERYLIGLNKNVGLPDLEWRDTTVYVPNINDWEHGIVPGLARRNCNCTVVIRATGRWDTTDCDTPYPFICSRDVDRCSINSCLNAGTCRQSSNEMLGFTCSCVSGWTGVECAQDQDECTHEPAVCQNGGVCINTPGNYTCDCSATSFEGRNCTIDANECLSNPPVCQNGGVCINTPGNYTCDCSATGFEGRNCTIDANECLNNPPVCQNGGVCNNTAGSYACDCGTSGYEGVNCSIDIDECSRDQNVCQHGGQCTNIDGSYTCDCASGYQGKHCSSDINECMMEPAICHNNGDCSNTNGSFTCTCQDDYEGRTCEAKINDCNTMNGTNLCKPGFCVDGVDSYTCVCPDGSSGTRSCPEETPGSSAETNNDANGGDDSDNSGDGTNNAGTGGSGPGSFEDDSSNAVPAGDRNSYALGVLLMTCLSVAYCSLLHL